MTRRDFDAAIAALARRQHGVFTRAQAFLLGGSYDLIDRRLASGAWIRLDEGVYALPGNPATWLRQCMAATLGDQHAVVSGKTAAALHALPGFPRGAIEITVPKGSNHRSRLARVRQSDLVERTRVHNIPVVTPAQCVVEIARFRGERQIGRLVEYMANADSRFVAALGDRYVELSQSRWPGIGRLRAALAQRGEGFVPPANELEAKLYDVLDRLQGCRYVRQAPLPWREDAPQRVDAYIPAWMAIIEGDGRRWHTRVDDFERDRERDNEAAIRGYRVLRFTWHQLSERVDYVLDSLARLAELASRSGSQPPIPQSAA